MKRDVFKDRLLRPYARAVIGGVILAEIAGGAPWQLSRMAQQFPDQMENAVALRLSGRQTSH